MAKNAAVVYLGYEDEPITERHRSALDFTTNKVGGTADWPFSGIITPPCPICGLNRVLILQIYAPLEKSQFHRTLYIFGCLNPICSTQSKSWACIRSQVLEKSPDKDSLRVQRPMNAVNINWCSAADEWNDTDVGYVTMVTNKNVNEENGNVIKIDNNRVSDEEEESNSTESDPIADFRNLRVDDRNANCDLQSSGANGRINVANPSAEIEAEESEVISIDTPLAPQRDLIALLKQPSAVPTNLENIKLRSFFLTVEEEQNIAPSTTVSEHVRQLLHEYEMRDEGGVHTPDSPSDAARGGIGGTGGGGGGSVNDHQIDIEQYEKGTPAHGDSMFHAYLSRIQMNPGQLMRYSRNALPILIAPISEPIPQCTNCGGDVICEAQILPTIIPRLILEDGETAPIEFGNVLIVTCSKNCWETPDKMRFENVIVQKET